MDEQEPRVTNPVDALTERVTAWLSVNSRTLPKEAVPACMEILVLMEGGWSVEAVARNFMEPHRSPVMLAWVTAALSASDGQLAMAAMLVTQLLEERTRVQAPSNGQHAVIGSGAVGGNPINPPTDHKQIERLPICGAGPLLQAYQIMKGKQRLSGAGSASGSREGGERLLSQGGDRPPSQAGDRPPVQASDRQAFQAGDRPLSQSGTDFRTPRDSDAGDKLPHQPGHRSPSSTLRPPAVTESGSSHASRASTPAPVMQASREQHPQPFIPTPPPHRPPPYLPQHGVQPIGYGMPAVAVNGAPHQWVMGPAGRGLMPMGGMVPIAPLMGMGHPMAMPPPIVMGPPIPMGPPTSMGAPIGMPSFMGMAHTVLPIHAPHAHMLVPPVGPGSMMPVIMQPPPPAAIRTFPEGPIYSQPHPLPLHYMEGPAGPFRPYPPPQPGSNHPLPPQLLCAVKAWWSGPQSKQAQSAIVLRQRAAAEADASGAAKVDKHFCTALRVLEQIVGVCVSGDVNLGLIDLGSVRQQLGIKGGLDVSDEAQAQQAMEGLGLKEMSKEDAGVESQLIASQQIDAIYAASRAMKPTGEEGERKVAQRREELAAQQREKLATQARKEIAAESRDKTGNGEAPPDTHCIEGRVSIVRQYPAAAPATVTNDQGNGRQAGGRGRGAYAQPGPEAGRYGDAHFPARTGLPHVVVVGARALPPQPMFSLQLPDTPGVVVLLPQQQLDVKVSLTLTRDMLQPLEAHEAHGPRAEQGIHGQCVFVALLLAGLAPWQVDLLMRAGQHPEEKEVLVQPVEGDQPGSGRLLVLIMRHVGVILTERKSDLMLLNSLSHKAPEWIPQHLKILFDTMPNFFCAPSSPLPALFKGGTFGEHVRSCASRLYVYTHSHPPRTGLRTLEVYTPAACVAPGAVGELYCDKLANAPHPLAPMLKLLLQEEQTMEADTRRWACRNIRVRVAVPVPQAEGGASSLRGLMALEIHDWPPSLLAARLQGITLEVAKQETGPPHRYRGPAPDILARYTASHQQLQCHTDLTVDASPPTAMSGANVPWQSADSLWAASGKATAASFAHNFKNRTVPAGVQPEWMLVLQVPGLPEDRPRPALGDVVFLRLAEELSVEFLCHVAWFDGDLLFLLPPTSYWLFLDHYLSTLVKQHSAGSLSSTTAAAAIDKTATTPAASGATTSATATAPAAPISVVATKTEKTGARTAAAETPATTGRAAIAAATAAAAIAKLSAANEPAGTTSVTGPTAVAAADGSIGAAATSDPTPTAVPANAAAAANHVTPLLKKLRAPLGHVRFTFDRTPIVRMHEALTTFIGLPHPFMDYPPPWTAVEPLGMPIVTTSANLWVRSAGAAAPVLSSGINGDAKVVEGTQAVATALSSTQRAGGQPAAGRGRVRGRAAQTTVPIGRQTPSTAGAGPYTPPQPAAAPASQMPGFDVAETGPRLQGRSAEHYKGTACLQSLRVWRVLQPFLTTPDPEQRPPLLAALESEPQLPNSLDFEISVLMPAAAEAAAQRRVSAQQPSHTPGSEDDPVIGALAESLQVVGSTPLNSEQRLAVAGLLHQCSRTGQGSQGGAGPAAARAQGAMPLPPVYADNWPMVLFGPPGTGKTVTLVEAALQLLGWDPVRRSCRPDAPRLLLVAPQNFSADNMCERLSRAGVPPSLMMRLNDPRRRVVEAQASTLDYCQYDEELRSFVLPSVADLATRKVIVCSCAGSGLLREGHYAASQACTFDVVLMDEAGQAMLPEALISLALLKPGGRAMLCGDPQQLGPSVRSMQAASAGLATSLLELLVRCAQYCAANRLISPVKVMWLVRNYRSEARLLDLPSRLFYQGRLQPWADARATRTPHWAPLQTAAAAVIDPTRRGSNGNAAADLAPASGNAVPPEEDDLPPAPACNTLFYGVRGQQRQEADAPSYFNPIEATAVANLVESLLSTTTKGTHGQIMQSVQAHDIGIICTYRRQVKKLRELLREKRLGAINVGTVDDFQGQEVRVVFISTVLTDPSSLPSALTINRGAAWGGGPLQQAAAQVYKQPESALWSNPARFNVAITRCKALLVVVGHPLVLSRDACWRELLRHCAARGAFQGAGAATLRRLLREGRGARDVGHQEEHEEEEEEEEEVEGEDDFQAAMEYITSNAVLGLGGAAQLYPDTLDEYECALMDDMPFRVAL